MFIALFTDEKRGKSQQGGLTPSSFRTTGGVHESVARAVRGECVRQRGKGKIGSFTAPRNFILPRVRTYRTRKPSRFVHALPARPLKLQGGRDSNMRADGTIKIILILLCSHTDAHPNLNREVRHSPTWHSSESESALERFEPVAVVKL